MKLAIATMLMLFTMIQFIVNFAGSMGVVVKNQFGASVTASQFGAAAMFLGFLFFGIPGGLILKRRGYRFTALFATGVAFAGMGVQLVSGIVASFPVYVFGAFVSGVSACLLNLVVNPMLNVLGGGGKKGNQLILIGCTLNIIGGMLAPLLTGLLVGGDIETAKVMDVAPMLVTAMAIYLTAFTVVWFVKIPEPGLEAAGAPAESVFAAVKDAMRYRNLAFGVLAVFLYEVIESGIPNMANLYMSPIKEVGPAVAGTVVSGYWLAMAVGCGIGGIVGSKVSARTMMICCSLLGVALLAMAINVPYELVRVFSMTVPKSMIFAALCGFATSIMWSSIFNLAVEGLGNRVEIASGIFMTMVCGGMLLPLQGLLADKVGILNSYYLTIALFLYLFLYAAVLSRPQARRVVVG